MRKAMPPTPGVAVCRLIPILGTIRYDLTQILTYPLFKYLTYDASSHKKARLKTGCADPTRFNSTQHSRRSALLIAARWAIAFAPC